MTLIGPGTWEAARAAVDVALTAVDLVVDGERIAYACCRPPGHHVTRSLYGGSCYLNNTAVAAAELVARVGGPVAVVDIDAHHGNGTQELFLGRSDVLTASVHVDPGAGWFPHFLGFAAENDEANLNLPLAPGTGDEGWLAAVREAAAFAAPARALVVALGVDAAAGDPESPLEVSAAGYREAGRILGELGAADRRRPGGRLRPRDDRAARRRDAHRLGAVEHADETAPGRRHDRRRRLRQLVRHALGGRARRRVVGEPRLPGQARARASTRATTTSPATRAAAPTTCTRCSPIRRWTSSRRCRAGSARAR